MSPTPAKSAAARSAPRKSRRVNAPPADAVRASLTPETVSYTHMTLPTNREV